MPCKTHHGDDSAARGEVDQLGEERLPVMLGVVVCGKITGRNRDFDTD